MFRFFENLVDPYCDYAQTDRPPTGLWPFMLEYCRPFYRIFWLAAFMSFVVAASELGLIYYLGWIVDAMQGDPQTVLTKLAPTLIGLTIFILVLRPLMYGLHVLLLNQTILPNLTTVVRWRSHRHVMRQSVGWFENDFAGRIANRVMQTPRSAGEAVFQVFDALSYSIAYVIGAFFLLFQADVRLTIPLVIWFGLYLVLLKWTVKNVEPASKASSDARSELNGRVVDSYTNIHSVKMFAHEDYEITYAKEAIENNRRKFIREMRIYSVMDLNLMVLNGLLIIGVVGWAVLLWVQGSASAGIVAAAAALVLRLNAMTGWIMWAITSFFREMGVVAEGMETIAQPVTLVDAAQAKDLKVPEAKIEILDVTHHYGRDSGGLDRLSLTIRPGEKVGLVGRSGAGKSTLFKLLLRFYDSESGHILIDGQDIAAVTQDSLRAQIGMVQQDSSLLHRSLRDNIRYGRNSASEAEISAAAAQAQADEFIGDLQDLEGRSGYDARVGERGVKLSGGQRQRIALARVILKDAPILLLDEATSALDSEVEAAIQDTLYGMMEGKTVIAIAHRLSTIAHMDRILVMDEGRIVEDGSHSELLAQGGLYAGFWARQSGGLY
ncbi:ABC transporter ATP-binding protein/permease [Rhodobacteraceae bacterium]|nr:ABC transporter ATP-binding protein/permease [Paracoccaceae bacterium]